MGDHNGRIISARATVDHVASDDEWLWYMLYVKCVLCVLLLYQPIVDYPLSDVLYRGKKCIKP